jgi:hypothetical protein
MLSEKILRMKTKFLIVTLIIVYLAFFKAAAFSQEDQDVKDIQNAIEEPEKEYVPTPVLEKLTLKEAYMCEAVKNFYPINPAVVFSISAKSICCFTVFDPVPEKMVIYHKWYRKDRLTTTQSLTLEPPAWRTYSSIQLREADKGPWRVEVVGPNGAILKTLRFSITD